ncbi:MAG: MBL fold metallo-hydrolase [Planctomycetota bacterium]|jgi:L-ascorbate metabolism protein UlaG (beta-lactamase superfamily)
MTMSAEVPEKKPDSGPRPGRRARVAGVICALLLVPVLVLFALYGSARPESGPKEFRPPPRDAIAFWGHACVYIDVGGTGILTDPVFSNRYSPTSRRLIGKPTPEACRGVRLVLLSHAHADHLCPESLEVLPGDVKILCSAPCAKHLAGRDFKVLELWEEYAFEGLTVTATPADHAGGRYSVDAEPDGRAVGFVIRSPQGSIYYTGDTRYVDGFREIGRRGSPDLAIMNVNTHLRGEAATRAWRDLGRPQVIPTHHDAFSSPTSEKNYKWQGQLRAAIGSCYREVPLGESVPLAELMPRGN